MNLEKDLLKEILSLGPASREAAGETVNKIGLVFVDIFKRRMLGHDEGEIYPDSVVHACCKATYKDACRTAEVPFQILELLRLGSRLELKEQPLHG